MGKAARPLRGLTRKQTAIWTVVHEAFGAVWLSLDLAIRLLGQKNPVERIVKKLAKSRRSPRKERLTRDQSAVGELMCAAVLEYSQSCYCASWNSGVEHELWDEVALRKEDSYERARARLRRLAGCPAWRRPRKRSLFAEGLRLLSDRYGIWVCYADGKGEKAVSIKEWLAIHQAWMEREKQDRAPYEEVWRRAHFRFGETPKPIPPMPKIKLPPMHASK
jgi:hypothetical protein